MKIVLNFKICFYFIGVENFCDTTDDCEKMQVYEGKNSTIELKCENNSCYYSPFLNYKTAYEFKRKVLTCMHKLKTEMFDFQYAAKEVCDVKCISFAYCFEIFEFDTIGCWNETCLCQITKNKTSKCILPKGG